MPNARRILVFGTTGSGKTSLCNTMTNNVDRMPVGSNAVGVTFSSHVYKEFDYNNNKYLFIDTVGLNEGNRGSVPAKDAVKALINLLRDSSAGYNLLIQVARFRMTQAETDNFDLFVKTITNSQIPSILVVTGLEIMIPMSRWLDRERDNIEQQLQLSHEEIICTCFAEVEHRPDFTPEEQAAYEASSKRYEMLKQQSRAAVYAAIERHARPNPIKLYEDDEGFLDKLKKVWNWFCDLMNWKDFKYIFNTALVEMLIRLGFSREEAERLVGDWIRVK
jgi:predicted GTPase